MCPRFEKVSSDVDTSHDVKSVGIYNKRGKVYIDRTAARELTSAELRAVEIHERVELTKRLEGKPYSVAHGETEELVPFTDDLKKKLHEIATKVIKSSYSKQNFIAPKDAFDLSGAMEGGAVDPYEEVERELIKRKIDKGQLRPLLVSEIPEEDLEAIIEQKNQRERVDDTRKKLLAAKDIATKGFEIVTDKANEYIEEQAEANLAGRAAGDARSLQEGMTVTKSTKDLKCTRCGKIFKPGDKVFKKVYTYYCPLDGGTLQPPRTPATKGFDILKG